ncbi:hypothetical protein ACFXQA_14500 [Microbacterium sp. P07]|uniref:hypothetical protein n=1 Tax=Microbacterium sp. P07 TaxID=3366952 RepID=UPI003745F62F
MVARALAAARDDGSPIALSACRLGYGVAASLNAPGAPAPTITDNELGGIVFYWKGMHREIQIEIDADSTYFIRVRGAEGTVEFAREGFGSVPMDEINASLQSWAAERRSKSLSFRA